MHFNYIFQGYSLSIREHFFNFLIFRSIPNSCFDS